MKIKTYNSNWEVFVNDMNVSIDTSADYINSDLFEDTAEIVEFIIEKIENETGAALDQDAKNEIETLVNIHFSDLF